MGIAKIARDLRRAALLSDGAGLTDGQLLECYLSRREEAAFEALVRRHGPTVLGVCRRVLRNEQDAEDAFQATFLVLLRKARSILPRDRVGNWLYGVAYRTSLKARAMRTKRRKKELLAHRPGNDSTWHELQPLLELDREVNRLPDKYREPVILCHLQGKTRQEAARILGWPEGTVATRLAAARRILARRLGSSMAIPIAAVPPLLIVSTARSAAAGHTAVPADVAALTGAVLKGMFMSKARIAMTVFLVLSALGLGVGAGSYQLIAGEDGDEKRVGRNRPADSRKEEPKSPETADGRLPTGPPPVQALVSLAENGQLAIKTAHTAYQRYTKVAPDGQNFDNVRVCSQLSTAYCKLSDIDVLDNQGQRIDKGQLPKLLGKEVLAMIYLAGGPIDPLHLRVIKDGVLIFVLAPPSYSVSVPPPPVYDPAQALPLPAGVETRVRNIVLAGNDKTSDEVILNAIPLYPGDVVTDLALRKAEQNLKRLNLFKTATVTLIESHGYLKDVLVTVKEK